MFAYDDVPGVGNDGNDTLALVASSVGAADGADILKGLLAFVCPIRTRSGFLSSGRRSKLCVGYDGSRFTGIAANQSGPVVGRACAREGGEEKDSATFGSLFTQRVK